MLKNTPNANANGTSFHGATVKTTVSRIKARFGQPAWTDGDKTQYDWIFTWYEEFLGEVHEYIVTLYDWKESRFDEDAVIEFHIGSRSIDQSISWDVARYLNKEIGL